MRQFLDCQLRGGRQGRGAGLGLLLGTQAAGKFTWWRGRPTMDGKTARGASSPAKPALTSPEPLSHTRAVVSSSSHILAQFQRGLRVEERGPGSAPAWGLAFPRPGRNGQSSGSLGGTCHLSSPRGRKTGVGGAAETGGRSAERKGRNDPGSLTRRLALCPRRTEGQSPLLTRSSPALPTCTFSQTGNPRPPHRHPPSMRCPSRRETRTRAGTPNTSWTAVGPSSARPSPGTSQDEKSWNQIKKFGL